MSAKISGSGSVRARSGSSSAKTSSGTDSPSARAISTTVPIVALRLFPAPVPFSGLSFSYNVSYAIFGGLTPVVLTLWLKSDKLAPAHYVGALAVFGALLAFVKLRTREDVPAR